MFKSPIKSYLIGKEEYSLSYSPIPDADYDRITKNIGSPLSIVLENGQKIKINKAKYVEIVRAMGELLGFVPVETKVLQARLD